MSYAYIAVAVASLVVGTASSYQAARTQKKVAENNAEVAEINARQAERKGNLDADAARRRSQQLAGTQRSSYAARGLDLAEGTPGDVIDQTDFFGAMDEQTSRSNAAWNAWALRRGGVNAQLQADAANPGMAATGSLLTSGSSVAGKWYGPKAAS
ncbi:MAG TPA: hypothetical protein VFR90_03225 [Methylibium sp.]|uniref:hypothetical protein n=1 Tax=Methylibium sp. TaxID=2067992 RepID=UPI002DB7FC7E|nr:hypothetical protein [Methylibium sp.]HEU4458112.1 hypothetical protein [Methylibium sp.]